MKHQIHQYFQKQLLSGLPLDEAQRLALQQHLESCPQCRQFAGEVRHLAQTLPQALQFPPVSASLLKQQSTQIRNEMTRKPMKPLLTKILRLAAFGALVVAAIGLGLILRAWLAAPNGIQPASQPNPMRETPNPSETTSPTAIPYAIDPALCSGASQSPYVPGEDIAFAGGRATVDEVIFEFWLTCANSTDNYTGGTQPLERLGLYAFWIYPDPAEESISDFYGFAPRSYPAIDRSPVTDGVTVSSGASGTLSVAAPGSDIPEGIFVLPDLVHPQTFVTRLETSQGSYSASISFRLEASENGYQPKDVQVTALPFEARAEAADTSSEASAPAFTPGTIPDQAKLAGPGLCSLDAPIEITPGSGAWRWPIDARAGVDQEFPGLTIYSPDSNAPVSAADSGMVIFSGENTTNGDLAVLIDHGNGYQTLYAELNQVEVACGEVVESGQVIAHTFQSLSGDAQSYLRFGVYYLGMPVQPMEILPKVP